jgi:molybdenum cofactor cytidylyltransferase
MNAKGESRVAAVVLAAGSSSRMGEAKQLLSLGERTLLEQVLRNLSDSTVDEILLVLGSSAETIQQRLLDLPVRGHKIVFNPDYAQGMASSLRTGLSAVNAGTNAALIVLADQPLIQPRTFDQIIERYRKSDAQIVIPTYKGFRGNPVLLDGAVFEEVMAIKGDIGCRAIFGNHLNGIVKVETDDIGILLDIDNQDDYERLRNFAQSGQGETTLIEAATRETRAIPNAGKSVANPESRDRLIIVGWEPVGAALVRCGQLLDFGVTVVDPLVRGSDLPAGAGLLNTLDFSLLPKMGDKYVVVASRGKFDEEAIEQALGVECEYIGLVANRKRGQEILHRLDRKGESPAKRSPVHVPAGLDIGAKSPEEIALSILAEIVSWRSTRARKE